MPLKEMGDPGERRAVILAVLVSLLFGAAGFIALTAGSGYFGFTLFITLPAAAAFVAACSVRAWHAVGIATLVSLSLALSTLLFFRLEGIVCVAMASPLIFLSAAIGAVLGRLVQRRRPAQPLILLFFASLL